MSFVAKSLRCASFGAFRPSYMCCGRVESSIVV